MNDSGIVYDFLENKLAYTEHIVVRRYRREVFIALSDILVNLAQVVLYLGCFLRVFYNF